MDHGQLAVVTLIMAALLIGGLTGFERTFHGRPAGFRTHALVCVTSALLMLVTVYQSDWMIAAPPRAKNSAGSGHSRRDAIPKWLGLLSW